MTPPVLGSLWIRSPAANLGAALVGWILTQVLLLQMYHVLQLVYGMLGAALILLALHSATRSYLSSR